MISSLDVDSYAFDRMHNMFTSDGMTYDPDSGELLIRKPTLKRKIEHVQEPQETIGPVATKKDDIVEEEEEEEEPEHGKEEEKPTETAAKRQRIEWAPKFVLPCCPPSHAQINFSRRRTDRLSWTKLGYSSVSP